jgi:hypothetical protein
VTHSSKHDPDHACWTDGCSLGLNHPGRCDGTAVRAIDAVQDDHHKDDLDALTGAAWAAYLRAGPSPRERLEAMAIAVRDAVMAEHAGHWRCNVVREVNGGRWVPYEDFAGMQMERDAALARVAELEKVKP